MRAQPTTRDSATMEGRDVRSLVLRTAHRAGVGHIGSALSVADILAALYGGVLRIPSTDHPDRDRFILSKGHAALAQYAALVLAGHLPAAALDEYAADGGRLGVHPGPDVPGIDFATGSLGHGLAYGAGAALAARMDGSSRRVFVLVSDAELNAGSTWESVMFAAHHRLGRLTVIADMNGQQAFGYTRDVLDPGDVAARFRSFGCSTLDLDGHDLAALIRTLSEPTSETAAPRVVIARTVFGKGVSFMEGLIPWHYLPMDESQFRQALAEVEGP